MKSRSWVWRIAVIGHGLLVILAMFVLMDRLKDYTPAEHRSEMVPLPPGGPPPAAARVYVLVLDSLRYETAMDPVIMPNLAHLRTEGVFARVANIHNAVTAPSLRAIFTGAEPVQLLGFVSNFLVGKNEKAAAPSLFGQLQLAGGRTVVCAGNEFLQFGRQVAETRRRVLPYSEDSNEEQLLAAADTLARGEANLVVGHLAYTDYASHRYGIYRQGYRQAFSRADRLLAAVRARLPAGATLVVLGDHGHTPDGRHNLGFSTPTFAVYVGARFRPALDLGEIRLASNRYLMSAALGLPLAIDGYAGELLPRSLVTYDPAQASIYAPPLRHDRLAPPGLRSGFGYALLGFYFAVLATLWLAVALPEWSPVRIGGWRWVPAWLAPLGCLLPLGWELAAGAVLGMVALLPLRRPPGSRGWPWLWLIGAIMAGGGFVAGGAALVAGLQAVPLPEVSTLHVLWLAVLAIGALVATRKNRGVVAWIIFALPALLLMPTNYRYGWNSVAVPALLGWIAFYGVAIVRERRAAGDRLTKTDMSALAALAGSIFLLIQAQMTGEGSAYVFSGWHALVPGWSANHPLVALITGPVAAFILLCDRPDLPRVRLGALALAVLLYPLQVRLWSMDSLIWPGLIGVVAVAWGVAHWRRDVLATAFGRWTGLALWAWWMRPAELNHIAICGVFAALVLAGRLMRRFPQPEWMKADLTLLLAIGTVAVGHAISRWSIQDLEWHAAYDWLKPETVEHYAPVVLIWILAKGLAPWMVMRHAVMKPFPAGTASPEPTLRAVLGLKCATVLLVMTGLGLAPGATPAYIEAAQQAAVLAMLMLYLLLSPP